MYEVAVVVIEEVVPVGSVVHAKIRQVYTRYDSVKKWTHTERERQKKSSRENRFLQNNKLI